MVANWFTTVTALVSNPILQPKINSSHKLPATKLPFIYTLFCIYIQIVENEMSISISESLLILIFQIITCDIVTLTS